MRILRYLICLAVLTTTASTLRADVIHTYNFTGTLADGGTVSGTVQLNLTTNLFGDADFVSTGYGLMTHYSGAPLYGANHSQAQYGVASMQPVTTGDHYFNVFLPDGFFVNTFTSGSIVGGEGLLASSISTYYFPLVSSSLTREEPTGPSAVPEPGSLLLLSTGSIAVLCAARRRFMPA